MTSNYPMMISLISNDALLVRRLPTIGRSEWTSVACIGSLTILDLHTGGRFYGGWWQNIPKEYRHHLAVNGKKMVELDYSNQHPSILYAQAAEIRPADCYADVVPSSSLPQDVTKKELRSAVKAAFNAMLNSPRPLATAPQGRKI